MNPTEELMARLLNHLAEKFKNQLILKGGMLLRLQGSPRQTQDLDFVWIRTKKRNIFAQEIKGALETLEGIEVKDLQTNSRGIFLQVFDRSKEVIAKIEISVISATSLPPKSSTTSRLSGPYALKTQVVSVMDLSEAFSHKIAASLERDLVRDLYDLMQMESLVAFDEATLRERLTKLEISRAKARQVSLQEAIGLLRERIDSLSKKKIEGELFGTLPQEEIVGLDSIIRAAVSRVIQRLEVLAAKK